MLIEIEFLISLFLLNIQRLNFALFSLVYIFEFDIQIYTHFLEKNHHLNLHVLFV